MLIRCTTQHSIKNTSALTKQTLRARRFVEQELPSHAHQENVVTQEIFRPPTGSSTNQRLAREADLVAVCQPTGSLQLQCDHARKEPHGSHPRRASPVATSHQVRSSFSSGAFQARKSWNREWAYCSPHCSTPLSWPQESSGQWSCAKRRLAVAYVIHVCPGIAGGIQEQKDTLPATLRQERPRWQRKRATLIQSVQLLYHTTRQNPFQRLRVW